MGIFVYYHIPVNYIHLWSIHKRNSSIPERNGRETPWKALESGHNNKKNIKKNVFQFHNVHAPFAYVFAAHLLLLVTC